MKMYHSRNCGSVIFSHSGLLLFIVTSLFQMIYVAPLHIKPPTRQRDTEDKFAHQLIFRISKECESVVKNNAPRTKAAGAGW